MSKVRLTENDIKSIVAEAVIEYLNEAYTGDQYAHLAGQANGAMSTLGGKIKGIFNPEWKKRKQRQEREFGRAATTGYGKHVINSPYETSHVSLPGNDYSKDRTNAMYVAHDGKSHEDPFYLQRLHRQYKDGSMFDYNNLGHDDENVAQKDIQGFMGTDMTGQGLSNKDRDELAFTMNRRNHAYRMGQRATNGTYKANSKTHTGTEVGGTGRNNKYLQQNLGVNESMLEEAIDQAFKKVIGKNEK
jgi:hypothetical protein